MPPEEQAQMRAILRRARLLTGGNWYLQYRLSPLLGAGKPAVPLQTPVCHASTMPAGNVLFLQAGCKYGWYHSRLGCKVVSHKHGQPHRKKKSRMKNRRMMLGVLAAVLLFWF